MPQTALPPSPLRLLRFGTVLGPLLLLAIAGFGVWQKQRAAAIEDVERSLDLLVQHVERIVETENLLLTYVDELFEGMAWSEIANSRTVHVQLKQFVARSELTANLALIDPAGKLRATSYAFLVEPIDLSDREYFRMLAEGDQPLAFGERIRTRILNDDVITIARRRSGERFDGLVAAAVPASKFQPFFDGLRKDPRTAVGLTRSDGKVLVRVPDIQFVLPPGSAFRQSIASAERGLYETASVSDGVARLVGFSRVPNLPLYVTYGLAVGTIAEAWLKEMAIAAAVALTIAVAGFVLASQAIQRQRRDWLFGEALKREVEARTIELRESEGRSKLLAAEVDHRAKNMLAVVQLLLRQTRAPTVPEYASAAQGRVAALARAHTLLSQSRWKGAELTRIVHEEMAPFRRADAKRVAISGPAILLEPRVAQSLAMALHELATNAAKYGALSSPKGDIQIEWRLENGDLVIVWTERNGPPVVPPSRTGLGTQVIARTIGQQLDGTVRYDWRPEGLVCDIVIPAQQLAAAPTDRV